MTNKSEFDVDLGKLFDEGFPDFKCLRCGNVTFYIFSDIREKILSDVKEKISRDIGSNEDTLEKIDIKNWSLFTKSHLDDYFVEVICKRCGYSERHFAPVLIGADKPIITEDRGNDG